MKYLTGQITISRVTSTDREPYIEIRFTDNNSRIQFATAQIEMKEFANALTGLGYQECELELVGLENVGKSIEHKSENVLFKGAGQYSKTPTPEAIAAIKAFEVDGWKGRAYDTLNYNNGISQDGRTVGYKVLFTRYV